MRTQKTRYFSKTKNEWITYVYTYEYRKKRGGKNPVLVGKGGRAYTDRIDSILDTFEDPAMKADARAILSLAKRRGERVTTTGLAAKLTDDKYEKMLINAGYSKESFEKETGVTFEEFAKKENWRTDNEGQWFLETGGKRYKYKHGYERSVLSES